MKRWRMTIREMNIPAVLICIAVVFLLASAVSCSVGSEKGADTGESASGSTPDITPVPSAQESAAAEMQEPSVTEEVFREFQATSDTYRTSRGIKTGDTVDKLFTAYDSGLLYQPGLQPDRDADFCIYDERFIYIFEEDNLWYLAFYVTDEAEGYKKIRGIEMGTGSDGGPVYSVDNETTFPVDYGHIEAYMETDMQVEELVHGLLMVSDTSPENADKIIAALPQMNWRIYSQLYNDGPTDFDDGPMNLIDWLYTRDITEEDEILSILKATHGLDGAYSEGYASILANIYLENPRSFIRQAGLLEPRELGEAAGLLAYGLYDHIDDAVRDLTEMAENDDLPAAEQSAADMILNKINEFYTG